MVTSLLQQASEYWIKLNRREQTLAMATAAILCAYLVFAGIRGAVNHVATLDSRIAMLSQDIINYSYQIAKQRSVDVQYAHMANQHSSAWTETEIMDRLRQELYRLALREPPTLDENGIPTETTNGSGDLVTIPQLRNGTLNETDEGYREYNISFQLPSTHYTNVLDYIERLQGSPQALRIDGLRLSRSPMDGSVATQFDIARIVVDNTFNAEDGGQAEMPVRPIEAIPLNPSDFDSDSCEILLSSEFATASPQSITIRSNGASGSASYKRTLPAGKSYEMYVDITAKGKATLRIAADSAESPFSGEAALVADGTPHQYRIRFTVPSGGGQRVALQVPRIHLEEPDSQVFLDNFSLNVLEG